MSWEGSFWSVLGLNQRTSKIDELLKSPGVTLEKLLDDENILSEIKSESPQLLEFFTDDKVKQLISYLIEEPPADADRSRGHKYPFIACEILTADVQSLLSAFFGRNPYKSKGKQEGNSSDVESREDNSVDSKEKSKNQEEGEHEDETKEEEAEKEGKEGEEGTNEGEESKKGEETEAKKEGEETEDKKEGEEEAKEEKNENEEENKENATEDIEQALRRGRFSIERKGDDETPEIQVHESADSAEVSEGEAEGEDNKQEIAHYFFSFLEQETLNPTLVGYFCRFLDHLFAKRAEETLAFIWKNPKIVDGLIKHSDHNNIANCLEQAYFAYDGTQSIPDAIDTMTQYISKFVEIFNTETSELKDKKEQIANLGRFLAELVEKEINNSKSKLFVRKYFLSPAFLDVLFANLLRDPVLQAPLTTVLNNLINFLMREKEAAKEEAEEEGEIEDPKEIVVTDVSANVFYEYLAPKIGEIAEYLEEGSKTEEVSRTYGGAQKPFGLGKLGLVQTFFHLIKLDENKINMEIGLKRVFGILLELMTTYEWNNMLHHWVERIIISALECDSHILKQKLMKQANLIGFINEATKDVYYKMENSNKRRMRKGYLGHITRIGKAIEGIAKTNSNFEEYVNTESWKEFNDSYLKPSVKSENHDLAGFSKKRSEDIFEEDNIHIGNNVDEALAGKFDSFMGFDQVGFNQETNNTENNGADPFSTQSYEKELEKWNEMFSSAPKNQALDDLFGSFNEAKPAENSTEKENIYLELNKEVKIVDLHVEGVKELELSGEFIESKYWAKPLNADVDVDDILKELEQN